ncbi:MAG: signal peptidase I [Bacteroidales bacterium]|nr:signal peptidase I [Bacteroidales bacterium]
MQSAGKINWIKAFAFSFLYLIFFSWMELWIILPGIVLIFDAFITHFIPWKKIRLKKYFSEKIFSIIRWSLAVVIAFILSLAIRSLFIEAYKIPTPSMEKTLMVGDYLFVSKLAYGPKLPNTPLAFPFMPNLLPNGRKSYSEKLSLPYKRLKGLGKVKRNDIVVFNFPEGDTVVVQYSGQNYYSLVRQYGREYLESHYDIIVHPVDMRDNYIKRCVGIPGDRVEINKANVYVNSVLLEEFSNQQFKYYLRTEKNKLSDSVLNLINKKNQEVSYNPTNSLHTLSLSNNDIKLIQTLPEVKSIQRYVEPRVSFKNTEVFPHNSHYRWTADNFGEIYIPAKGATIELNQENLPIYKRLIQVYENNKIEIIDGEIYINNVLSRSYTFRMNYYFVLGDNRHNSADSRYWGFVPENHLVGKATWIWFSVDPEKPFYKALRIKRMFKSIK